MQIKYLSTAVLLCAGILGTALFPTVSTATCTSSPVLQPDTTFPALPGRVVYHSYSTYGDGSSNLFLYDFVTKINTQLNTAGWGLLDPMNAHFSPDGKRITFMAQQNGYWNVFVWTVGSATAPQNITTVLGGRNEDPKFSFDGKKIVFKHEADIRIATLVFNADGSVGVSSWTIVTNDGWAVEDSMPFLTPSGKYVFYTTGSGSTLVVYRMNLQTMVTQKFAVPPTGAHDYYPIVRDYSTVFFSRAVSFDQIMMAVPNAASNAPFVLPLNSCTANNSDAAPVDEDYLIFSSGAYDPPYGLAIGDIKSGKIWRFSQTNVNVNDGKQKLGASYTAAR